MTIKSDQVQQIPPIEAIFFRDWKNSYIPNILEEIYLREIYKPFLSGKRDLVIADFGANIGLASYFFKDYAKEVFAVEPSHAHLLALNEMIKFNKIKNVTVCPYGISNMTEKRKFYLHGNSTAHSLTQLGQNIPFEEVDVVSFDEFMVRNKLDQLDLLKMDTEGEENKIFTSDGFLKYKDKIKVILGEWHDWNGTNQAQFANMFRDYGFEFNWLPNMKAAVFSAVKI